MIKTIFFDIDDTLYDHSYHVESGISALQRRYPELQKYSTAWLIELTHRILEEVHVVLLTGSITPEESRLIRWRKFLDECGADRIDPAVIASQYSQAYYASERTVPGTQDLLAILKRNYSLGVISNNLFAEQLQKMHRIGIAEYFETFTISEEAGAAKPDPRIFEIALDRADAKPRESVFIGDSWANDIIGAKNAGIKPIWFNRKKVSSPDVSVHEIICLEEIPALLL